MVRPTRNRENRPLVINELVEFKEHLIEIQDFEKTKKKKKRLTHHVRGIYEIYLKEMKDHNM